MNYSAVIFDMDGLLINSEPYWEQAGEETLAQYGVTLSQDQYHSTTGLRTREWVDWWFSWFDIDKKYAAEAEKIIVTKAIEKIRLYGKALPGADYIFDFFREKNFKIGIATSSPVELVNVVAEKLNIRNYLQSVSSAEELNFGKPHPQVYLNCANELNTSPLHCICFEDSFNGMIAAKAARMKCVVVPAPHQHDETRWDAADIKLQSLLQFNQQALEGL